MPAIRHHRKRATARRARALRLAQLIRVKPGDLLLLVVDPETSVAQSRDLAENLRRILPADIKGVITSTPAIATVIRAQELAP